MMPPNPRHGFWWTLTAVLSLGLVAFLAAALLVVLAVPIAIKRLLRR